MNKFGSKEICVASIKLAISPDREVEDRLKAEYRDMGISVAAVDFGGEFISSVTKVIERTVVAAKKEGLIENRHAEEGAVAGAAREALSQIVNKAMGLNVGGKIGIARYCDHVCVCVFFGIGLLHLNEMAISIGHRVI
jgi:hypothetical protein